MAVADHPRIFISVAEQSADEHAAALIRAFRTLQPKATFHGLAGPAMQAENCECLKDMTSQSAMGVAAFRRVPEAYKLLRQLKDYLTAQSFDAAVMVDSPALNLPIAKLCRRFDIPVLYFIAPQTWAWGPRKWRNARIKCRVNRLACLWPFEQPYFRAAGIKATYVGHPSFDRLLTVKMDDRRVRQLQKEASPVIAILPGSRRHVVNEVLPGQLEVARALAVRFPRVRFLIVTANDEVKKLVEASLNQIQSPTSPRAKQEGLSAQRLWDEDSIQVLSGASDRASAIRAADLALVASGTVTLEIAYHATPMIVMYNAGKWPYLLLAKWLITTKHFSIPNILAGREIVPEFMPYYRSTDPIIARAVEWLSVPETLARVRKDLTETIRPILKTGAAANTAKELAELLQENAIGIDEEWNRANQKR